MDIKTVNITSTLRICPIFIMAIVLLSCITTQQETGAVPTTLPTLVHSPTVTPKATSVPTLAPTSIPISPPTSIIIQDQPGELYKTVFTIPVGDKGVTYQGVGIPDMEVTGPNALAILPDGSFIVADLVSNCLFHYDPSGQRLRTIELDPIGIVNVADLRASKTELILLEVSFEVPPKRYRVNRLTFDGRLVDRYDIPKGFHLENGLTGITVDCEGTILLELEAGTKLHRLVDPQGSFDPAIPASDYSCKGQSYRVINPGPGETPYTIAGNIRLETQLTAGLGGLTILGVLEDGSFYLVREDAVIGAVIQVDQTVHYIRANGTQQGVARVPIAEYYYPVKRNLAIGPDGYVYALFPQPDSVHIVRLNLFESIEPFLPEAVTPLVTLSNEKP